MKRHYSGTALDRAYKAEVQRVFNCSEHCRFVRDLRNFMTHRELPDSNYRINFTRIGEVGDGTDTSKGVPCEISAGVHYKTERFLEWNGWTAPARRYLIEAGDEIELRTLFEGHVKIMHSFDEWLVAMLTDYHKADFDELFELQNEQHRLEQLEVRGNVSE